MKLELTAVFRKVPEGYVGFVEELPGANTQRENLEEAVRMVPEANRELARADLSGQEVIREPFQISGSRIEPT